jgi:penicillin-binding protein 2
MFLSQGTKQMEEVFGKVSRILGVNLDNLKSAFNEGYIAPSVPITIAKNIDIKKAIALEELKVELPGIIIQPRPQRRYPYGKLACHILGYVNEIDRWRLTKLEDYGYKTKDIVGFGGIEEKYDYYLRQEEGGLSVEVDHRGRFMRVLGFKPPRNGQDMQLTLNLKIQKIVEDNLGDRKGCVILMNPYSGEIIAMASSPDFNPTVFVNKLTLSISDLFNDPAAPLINRAISATYPAGSVFKIVVATAALETGKINLNTSFLCQGSLLIGKQEFACWNKHGEQNLIAAIAHSCNVFFYKTGLVVGAQLIHDYAVKFGLSKTSSIDLPYEASGIIPSPLWQKIYKFKNWFNGDTANLSIGQGEVSVTPLQIVRMIAVFANEGYLVRPYIVKAIETKDISIYQRQIEKVPLKGSTIDYIRQGLRRVVSDSGGTANVLQDLPVSVAGKTGTAQAPGGQPHAWFVGFFPFKNPKFVICVFLERGGPGYVSSVLAKQIIQAMCSEGLI